MKEKEHLTAAAGLVHRGYRNRVLCREYSVLCCASQHAQSAFKFTDPDDLGYSTNGQAGGFSPRPMTQDSQGVPNVRSRGFRTRQCLGQLSIC